MTTKVDVRTKTDVAKVMFGLFCCLLLVVAGCCAMDSNCEKLKVCFILNVLNYDMDASRE